MDLKESILQRTNRGLDYFILVYREHGITLKQRGDKLENTHNLFYFDKTPSFSIYFNKRYNRWYFKDHGTNDEEIDYYGDVFDFAFLYHKLDKGSFYELLHRMDTDITMSEGMPLISKSENYTFAKLESKSKKYELLKIDPTEKAIEYFNQFGINLNHYSNINQIHGIRFLKEDGTLYYIKNLNSIDEIHISYDFITYAKIYSIKPKGFTFVGSFKGEYTFGSFEFADYLNEPLFITGGEKDVMTLQSLGYNAFCLLSETTTRLSQTLIKAIYKSGHQPIVLYDTDKTGKRSANKLYKNYEFAIADLATIIPEKYREEVTDISDYVRLQLDRGKLVEFLNSFIPKEKLKMDNGILLDGEIYKEEL